MTGRMRVTLAELGERLAEKNRREAEERELWLQTDEGKAWLAQQRRLVEADERYAAEHPETQTPENELEAEDAEAEEDDAQ